MKNRTDDRAEYQIHFSANYLRFSGTVARFINRFVYNHDLAEELRQDVFLKVWERGVILDPHSPRTLGFLLTVAKNTAIDHLRRKKSEREKLRSMHLDEVMMDRRFYEDIENNYLRGEIISTMRDVIDSFPEREKSVFIDKHLRDRKRITVSRERGVSVYRLKKIEREIVRKIRERLGDYFDAVE